MCIMEFQDTFTKFVFPFFEPFRVCKKVLIWNSKVFSWKYQKTYKKTLSFMLISNPFQNIQKMQQKKFINLMTMRKWKSAYFHHGFVNNFSQLFQLMRNQHKLLLVWTSIQFFKTIFYISTFLKIEGKSRTERLKNTGKTFFMNVS